MSDKDRLMDGEPVDMDELLCLEKITRWLTTLHTDFFTREQEIDEGFLRAQQKYLDGQM